MKKLLVYAHYYYPDVASTGQILTELCESLVDTYDVTVICTVPSYTGKISGKYKKEKYYFEEINGVHVVRVSVPEFDKKNKISRIKNIYAYYKNAIKITKKLGKFDLVYALSQPPILGGMLGRKGKLITGGKLIYNIQDFNPEQMSAVKFNKSKILTNTLMNMDKKTCRESDLVITVGNDMKETLNNRFKDESVPNNVVINNWINEKEIHPLKKDNKKIKDFKKKYKLDNKFIIMYSGNLGLYYDLENIIKLYNDYKDRDDIAFVFVGDGSIKQKLIEYKKDNKLNNVVFIPYQDKKDLNISLNAADVHLVTNAKGIKGVSVPSKIYGCLATNVPVFGILEKNSEAANIIEKSKCGIVSETGNYEDIKNNLDMIIKNKDKFVKKYSTGRKYLEDNYTKDKSIEKYKKEIEKVEKKEKIINDKLPTYLLYLLIFFCATSYIGYFLTYIFNDHLFFFNYFLYNYKMPFWAVALRFLKDITVFLLVVSMYRDILKDKKSRYLTIFYIAITLLGSVNLIIHNHFSFYNFVLGIRLYIYVYAILIYCFNKEKYCFNNLQFIKLLTITNIINAVASIVQLICSRIDVLLVGSKIYRLVGLYGSSFALSTSSLLILVITLIMYYKFNINKRFLIVNLIISILLCYTSGVRSVMLCLLALLVLWGLSIIGKTKISKWKKIFIYSLVGLLMIPVSFVIVNNVANRGNFIETQIKEGRIAILVDLIKESRPLELILGNGIGVGTNAYYLSNRDSQIMDSTFNLVYYQFGLIGLIGLIILMTKLLRARLPKLNMLWLSFGLIIILLIKMLSEIVFENYIFVILFIISLYLSGEKKQVIK